MRFALAVLLLAGAAFGQDLKPDEALRKMKVPEGFQVKLVASEPDIRQPLTITFDDRGRLWLIQYLQYPNPAGLKAVTVDQYLRTKYDHVPDPPPKGPKGADRITILEDKDGDGRFETVKDFVTGLNIATGLALGHGGAFVVQSPYLLFYPDRNGDDVPDGDPEVLLSGFGLEDTHSLPNSLQWGPDGWLYGAAGSTSSSNIRGIEFQQGLWRYHPISKEFELYSEGGGNTWGLDFDRHGNAIAGTNWGGQAMLHQVQGAYYLKGFGKHGPLHNPYTFGYFDHVPYRNFKGGHVTCGGVVYQSGAYPESFAGTYIAANVLSNNLYWHVFEPKGSTFTAHHGGDFLIGNDPWFRPIDLLTGPDGSVFVVDWYDARANHVDPRDNWDKRNGRIYKVEYQGTPKLDPFQLSRLKTSELVALLSHKNDWFRREARRLLTERRDPTAYPTLRALIADRRDDLALEALWTLYGSGGFDDALAETLLAHPHEDVRSWTVRLLCDPKKVTSSVADRLADLARKDASAAVRSQLACSAKRLPAADALPVVRELLKHDEDADDLFIPMLLWWAIEDKSVSDRERVLGLLNSPEAWHTAISRRFIQERLARRYMAEGGEANIAACATMLSSAPGLSDVGHLVQGMEKALEGRRLEKVPAPLEKPLAELRKQQPADPGLLKLALRLGSPEAFDQALKAVSDPTLPEAARISLIEILGQSGRKEASQVLLETMTKGSDGLRSAALQALQPFPDPEIAKAVIAAWPRFNAALKARALTLLFSRPSSGLEFMKEIEAGRVQPKEIALDQVRRLAAHEDPQLAPLIEKHWGRIGAATPGEKRAQIASLQNIVRSGKGDRSKGKVLYTKTCGVCHLLWDEGGKIGPELTGADRKNLELLGMNIVDPSAVIRGEFSAQKIQTTDGQVLTGLVLAQDAGAVTLVDAQNNKTVIARDRIGAMKASEVSLMPEKLLDPFDDQQIRDIFAYLMGDGPVKSAPQEKAGTLKVCLVSGSLEYESDASLSALQEHLESKFDVKCSRAFRKTDEDLPGLEALDTADVMVLFTRRLKPAPDQLERIKKYCASGRPIVALRTASHAFQNWLDLDKEILGGSYDNHFGKGPPLEIEVTEKGKGHPILEGVKLASSTSSLYKNPRIAGDCDILLRGSIPDHVEPLAWTRVHNGGRLFYTSLGDQKDFQNPDFLRLLVNALFWTAAGPKKQGQASGERLAGTGPIEGDHDFAAEMVAGIDRFLLAQIDASVAGRERFWKRDRSSIDAYQQSVAPNRERLRKMIGAEDPRVRFEAPEWVGNVKEPAVVGQGPGYDIMAVRWPAVRGVWAEGLFLNPKENVKGYAVVIPDADQTPEMSAGLERGIPPANQMARKMVEQGYITLVPTLIDRSDTWSVSGAGKATNQPHREFVYRPAFEMGRTVVGYEVQKVLAAVDWFEKEMGGKDPICAVVGSGEGAMIALYAAALDPRIDSLVVDGYFGSRQKAWEEPIYRNLFGLLREFGDAEVASLVSPRAIENLAYSSFKIDGPPAPRPGRGGAAPGRWSSPAVGDTAGEMLRSHLLTEGIPGKPFSCPLDPDWSKTPATAAPKPQRELFDPAPRQKRQVEQMLEDTQVLLRQSEKVRETAFWKRVDRKSLETWEKSTAPLRDEFYGDVIGRFDEKALPPNVRSRRLYDEPKYVAYEIQLDVYKDVFAYGWLLVPKDIKEGERRPVVVCQHGLEGRPADVADPKKNNPAYERYACRLAERGFVVFAPQNPYIGQDKFRTLQRKANLLGKHLFSIIIPQHQAITDWLASLPYVDPDRIAFYGLSYGGKTAMRVPAVVTRYCLSICSADFNDWIWKNAALDSPYSYVTTGEYEIFEWNLGNTYNYAEMAALIAPRPFMVERGHYDGVAPDERVAYEYAKIKRFYDELKIGDRTEIEVFTGPHKINGVGTFDFLHKHLKWPKPDSK